MAIAEPTADNITKYWVTDTQLQLLANAIRKEGGTTALLTYPDGFVSAINSLDHVKTESLNVAWPAEYNNIYWTTQTELQNIANAIRSKNSSSETLTFLEDFVDNLVIVNETSEKLYHIYPGNENEIFAAIDWPNQGFNKFINDIPAGTWFAPGYLNASGDAVYGGAKTFLKKSTQEQVSLPCGVLQAFRIY